jgi:hypothetical protein
MQSTGVSAHARMLSIRLSPCRAADTLASLARVEHASAYADDRPTDDGPVESCTNSIAQRTTVEWTVPAYVVVQFTSAVRRGLASRSSRSSDARRVRRILTEHDGVVLPSTDFAADAGVEAPYTTIEVPDMASANRLATALRDMDGVESAYAKPGEELP